MWENINGEWIFMDKEMGADEYERQNAGQVVYSPTVRSDLNVNRGSIAGSVAFGVAGGMIVAKVASRVWGWFWWMVVISVILMFIM